MFCFGFQFNFDFHLILAFTLFFILILSFALISFLTFLTEVKVKVKMHWLAEECHFCRCKLHAI